MAYFFFLRTKAQFGKILAGWPFPLQLSGSLLSSKAGGQWSAPGGSRIGLPASFLCVALGFLGPGLTRQRMQGGCEREESPPHPDSLPAQSQWRLRWQPGSGNQSFCARADSPLRAPLTPNSLVVPKALTQRTSLLTSCLSLRDSMQSDHVVRSLTLHSVHLVPLDSYAQVVPCLGYL